MIRVVIVAMGSFLAKKWLKTGITRMRILVWLGIL